jgi:hypothetical protein
MTDQPTGFMKTGLPAWLVIVLGLVVLALAGGVALVGFRELAVQGERPVETVTRIKNPGTSVFMAKHVQRFKGGSQITLTIGGGRSDEEPFAFYTNETRSEFHWDHDKLIACVEGATNTDKSYWLDHVTLPDGGEVQIVKACPTKPAP